MPRKKLQKSFVFPYHIHARANNKDWFNISKGEMWDLSVQQLFNVTIAYGLRVHAFTLMDNHFHLLGTTPFGNLGEVMNYFMRETSKEANRRTGRINHFFGGSYKASMITDPHYYLNALRYIYQNPIRAEICQKVEEYPFTSLSILFGQMPPALPIYPSVFDFRSPLTNNFEQTFKWLNKKIPKELNEATSCGLKRTKFSMPTKRDTRKPFEFLTEDLGDFDALLNQK